MINITFHTRKGCHWCDKFKDEEQEWVPPNWNMEEVEGGVSSYPQFVVSVDSKSKTLVGFHTIAEIREAIDELSNE